MEQYRDDEKPNWINFFDGELFRRYQDFARTRDFSQVLMTLREGITAKDKPKWPQQEISLAQSVQNMDLSNYKVGYNSEVSSGNYTADLTDEMRKQRTKRTRTFILLGMLIICLVALLVALLFHFHSSKSLFGSGSSSTISVRQPTRPTIRTRRPAMLSSTTPSTTTFSSTTTTTTFSSTTTTTFSPTITTTTFSPTTTPITHSTSTTHTTTPYYPISTSITS